MRRSVVLVALFATAAPFSAVKVSSAQGNAAASPTALQAAQTKRDDAQAKLTTDVNAFTNGSVTGAQLEQDRKDLSVAQAALDALAPRSKKPSNNNCTFPGATPADKGCIVTGAFTIPFKFELAHNKDVFGSASLNGFLGYNPGPNLFPRLLKFLSYPTYIMFVGYSANFNSTSNPATPNSTSASTGAVSYGAGIAFPIGGTFQDPNAAPATGTKIAGQVSQVHIGAVIGFDHVASSLKYPYNDKPWVSVFIGTSF